MWHLRLLRGVSKLVFFRNIYCSSFFFFFLLISYEKRTHHRTHRLLRAFSFFFLCCLMQGCPPHICMLHDLLHKLKISTPKPNPSFTFFLLPSAFLILYLSKKNNGEACPEQPQAPTVVNTKTFHHLVFFSRQSFIMFQGSLSQKQTASRSYPR